MAAITQPATWADGDSFSPANLNAVSALQTWYYSTRPLFHARCSTNISWPESTWQAVTLAVVGGLDCKNRGFTFTDPGNAVYATVPGWYDFCYQVGFQSTANGLVGVRAGGVKKNTAFVSYQSGTCHEVAAGFWVRSGNGTVYLNGTTDYLGLWQYKTTAVNADTQTAYSYTEMNPQLGIWWVGRNVT